MVHTAELYVCRAWTQLVSETRQETGTQLVSETRQETGTQLVSETRQETGTQLVSETRQETGTQLVSETRQETASWPCPLPGAGKFSLTPLPSTPLVSFPGSGNTWTRHLLTTASGERLRTVLVVEKGGGGGGTRERERERERERGGGGSVVHNTLQLTYTMKTNSVKYNKYLLAIGKSQRKNRDKQKVKEAKENSKTKKHSN